MYLFCYGIMPKMYLYLPKLFLSAFNTNENAIILLKKIPGQYFLTAREFLVLENIT